MPRAIVTGNGNLLTAFNKQNMLCDLYFPYVGMEAQIAYQHQHRIGVFVDNQFSWLYKKPWQHKSQYITDTLVTDLKSTNSSLNLEFNFNDFVYPEADVLIRKITIKNTADFERDLKLFFSQDFHLYSEKQQDTAFYEPEISGVIHYRKQRYFLISGIVDQAGIDSYATGKSEYHNLEWTWRDAEDGKLEENPIDQGSVDSTVQFNLQIPAHSEKIMFFWICAGTRLHEVRNLHKFILDQTPEKLLTNATNYWKSWVSKGNKLDAHSKYIDYFRQSLLIIRTQIDNRGAIIAANDSDIMKFNKDTYTYMWPRDGAWVTLALDKAGYGEIGQRFFQFCADVISEKGYLLHKYNPDKSVGSSWHPWFQNGESQIPIQEDETALTLYALSKHYQCFSDIEFIQKMYEPLIRNGGNFLVDYIDKEKNLPLPSYDLWERERAIFAYTCATTYAGLKASAKLSETLGHFNHKIKYTEAAEKVRQATLKYLYDEKSGRFLKAIRINKKTGIIQKDYVLDASLHGLWMLDLLPADDTRILQTNQAILETLAVPTSIGGLARYENDDYMRVEGDYSNLPGNPWIVTTLWHTQWLIALAKTPQDLQQVEKYLDWTINSMNSAMILPEQLNPFTGEHLSVAPLTWSHATFVATILKYNQKKLEI